MNERKLLEALAPVKAHFHGAKVTPSTVLAAYLRAAGISPGGDDWQLAKAAFDAGAGFEEAVSYALRRQAQKVELAAPDRGRPLYWPAQPQVRRASDDDVGSVEQPQREAGVTDLAYGTGSQAPDLVLEMPFVPTAEPELAGAKLKSTDETLIWFPKVCGPGDLIGEGAKKLLGQPKLSPVALLVRETAQNSWDARSGPTVDFVINLRLLTRQQHEVLRSQILTGNPRALGLRESLEKEDLWVIEVSDRGTKGLGGPLRNDKPVSPLEPTDFIDLLFNVGAPRDVHLGGGTYGFGKTVGYLISNCGTTVIWSQCETPSGIESRLIASAIGGGYEDDAHRYTGRHWWGVVPSNDRVEPAIGEPAASLGTSVFERAFKPKETGTSILIIDPNLGGESRMEDAQRIAQAALWNLWPKLVPAANGIQPMRIDVQLNGRSISMPNPLQHPVLGAYAQCLETVRAVQDGVEPPALPFGQIEEVWSHNPRTLLGHLALTRFAMFDPEEDLPSEEINPLRGTSHHVCLMRHSAELVVRYEEGPPLEQPGYYWAGVFRPVAAIDDSFAQSEPPAHDDWVVDSLTDRTQKSHVRVAFTRLKEFTRQFTEPADLPIDAPEANEPISTRGVAESLGSLIAGLGGVPAKVAPSPSSTSGRARRSQTPTVVVISHRLSASPRPGSVRADLMLQALHPSADDATLTADITAVTEGGEDKVDNSSLDVRWFVNAAGHERRTEGQTCVVPSGTETRLCIDFPYDIAINVDVRAG